jgi:DNA helicase-4
MDFISNFLRKRKEKIEERDEKCEQLLNDFDTAIVELDSFFKHKVDYIEVDQAHRVRNKWSDLLRETTPQELNPLRRAPLFRELISGRDEFISKLDSLPQRIREHNNRVAKTQIQAAYDLIGDVEGRRLDQQQMLCIVKKATNHLVIAGAGTGKTTTIVGKIKYLLKANLCKPEDILVLSFTNASAAEMKERINKETGENIDASTFHKLGLTIIAEVNRVMPKISQLSLSRFVKEKLNDYLRQPKYLYTLVSYLQKHKIAIKSEFEFSDEADYEEYLQINPPLTIKNETVKSYGELEIANFLNQNSIAYIYEQPYSVDTRTSEYAQYHPDFYLPEYNVYIEYFGVNSSGEVPSFFKGEPGKSATRVYREKMEWKRGLHKENQTTLIECFAYEKASDVLLEILERNLVEHGVVLKPKTPDELWSEIKAAEPSVLDGIIELFVTVINLIKSNDYLVDDLRRLNLQRSQDVQANSQVIDLVEPLFEEYDRYLKTSDEIDFNDMINLATRYVREGKFNHGYKVVIVDEYQDISRARYSLLKAMRDSREYSLFCVGDDWQSIYRFAGSDIGFILNFEQYWGPTEKSKIETTYRFTKKLIEVSGDFIMQNPKQIEKTIRGEKDSAGFALGEVNGYTEKNSLDFLASRLVDLPQGSSVFFIGRYGFDVDLFKVNELFVCKYNNVTKFTDVVFAKRKDLKMQFLTAHRSKGLQADYVVIVNNKNTKMGFPSRMQDASILRLLLDDCDDYPYAEERRLFYVAMTRAKKKAIMLTLKEKESIFARELKRKYGSELKREAFECPLCGGQIVRKTGKYGVFMGCSNYNINGCRYVRKG